MRSSPILRFLFFNDTATTEIYTLSLHDALPICGTYVFGGVDPNNGVDCSGFTRYILQNTASISLPHSSKGQSNYGTEVSEEEMQPGDLIFYGDDAGINHVAMYIGNGQIVHASTEATGIKTSPYNYRKPVKIVSVLS